jgi:hypothetical protein
VPLPSKIELDDILKRIDSRAYGDATYKPERLPAEQGHDIISVPNDDATTRTVYERRQGEEWKEVPFLGGKSDFE